MLRVEVIIASNILQGEYSALDVEHVTEKKPNWMRAVVRLWDFEYCGVNGNLLDW
jgi:hypothetical protein